MVELKKSDLERQIRKAKIKVKEAWAVWLEANIQLNTEQNALSWLQDEYAKIKAEEKKAKTKPLG